MSEKKEVSSVQVVEMIQQLLNIGIFPGSMAENLSVAKQFINHSLGNMESDSGKKEEESK